MTAKEVLEAYEDNYYPGLGNSLVWDEDNILKAMKIYAKIKCEEQRQICADVADYNIIQNDDGEEPFHHERNITVNRKEILDAQEPNFD